MFGVQFCDVEFDVVSCFWMPMFDVEFDLETLTG